MELLSLADPDVRQMHGGDLEADTDRKLKVARLLGALTDRERAVVEAHMGGATFAEMATEIGGETGPVSVERMRQIERMAIRKMQGAAYRAKMVERPEPSPRPAPSAPPQPRPTQPTPQPPSAILLDTRPKPKPRPAVRRLFEDCLPQIRPRLIYRHGQGFFWRFDGRIVGPEREFMSAWRCARMAGAT